MTNNMIEATDIVKILGHGAGRVEALKGVNLSLAGGELTLLMGPSGSGKTTLLSVLGCMLSPTSGTVQIRGRSTTGLDSGRNPGLRGQCGVCVSIASFVSDAYRRGKCSTGARCARRPLARHAT